MYIPDGLSGTGEISLKAQGIRFHRDRNLIHQLSTQRGASLYLAIWWMNIRQGSEGFSVFRPSGILQVEADEATHRLFSGRNIFHGQINDEIGIAAFRDTKLIAFRHLHAVHRDIPSIIDFDDLPDGEVLS